MAKKTNKKKVSKSEPGRGRTVVIGLLLFVAACAGYLVFKPTRVLVPALVGKTEAEAQQLAKDSGLSVVVKTQETDQADQDGKVLVQVPAAGVDVPRMSVVTITVAKGPEGVALPDLAGKTRSEAEDTLVRLGMTVAFVEKESDSVPIGRVISQDPVAGTKTQLKSKVTLTVSGGAGDIVVPDLTNMTLEEARAALESLGLTLGVAQVAQDGFREGDPAYVLRQEPAAGETLGAGSKVTIFLPIAPPVSTTGTSSATTNGASHAPRFEGMTVGAAKKLAEEQGVILELADSADDSRLITFQDPPPGDPLDGPSASVVIRVSEAAIVPRLSGLNETEARTRLQQAGFSLGTVRRVRGDIAGEVIDQRPSSGIEAIAGSTVDLVVADPSAAPSSAQGPAPNSGFTPDPWAE